MKTRICLIQSTMTLGGGTKSFVELCLMLNTCFEVVSCIPKSKNNENLKKLLQDNQIKVYEIKSNIPILINYSGSSSFFSPGLIKKHIQSINKKEFVDEIMSLNPHMVFFNSVITSVSAKYFPTNIKKICIVRETLSRNLISKYYKQNFEQNFDLVLFISENERTKMNLLNVKSEVLTDSLLVEIKDENKNTKDGKTKILFLGGMDYIKGLDTLLEAAAELDCKHEFIIAGYIKEIKYKDIILKMKNPRIFFYYLKLKRLMNNNKNIKYIGFQEDVIKLIKESDAVVFPSKKVHQPKPAIEAGYFSKPVIISDFFETSDNFINNYNALVFEPNNFKDLIKKIKLLETKGKQIGENNFKMSTKYHDYETNKKKLIDLIKEVTILND
ncbi:glycosyltransferase [Vagococcus fluvialis]|uniref:glycosyltransferase n=1 Tax=Vagococcus fluvialis TaxID=2738 RepID=UPI001D0ADE79|nr:glycosyltransferase [Vagococcus fluvialis]UDM78973.1 glycosyltransferase [Vagococcus fluvialis]